jgi:signal transduction histidine kinase
VVAVSLVISGFLTGYLVRNLEFQNARDQLDRQSIIFRQQVWNRECSSNVYLAVGNGRCAGAPAGPTPRDEYIDRLATTVVPSLNGDRLLLVTRSGGVVFDSENTATVVSLENPTARVISRENAVGEIQIDIDGVSFLAALAPLTPIGTPTRDPLGAQYVMLARSRSAIDAQATASLLPLLLVAGGVSMLVAILIALLVSRALARPLTELSDAAEDIARGNYSRRVSMRGNDEIGVTGQAFNRMAEAVERARQAQREFLANVSHELKTPLTSLIGFSQALVDGSLETEEEKRRAATVVHEESERVLRMSQELLDLARVEGGHISLQPMPIDVAAMLKQELDIIRPRAHERGLKVTLETTGELPPGVADPERLHQVLDNLLDNAVKYAPADSNILVSAQHLPDGAIEVQVANPVGEHRPDPDRMFERFYRADPSRSSSAGGVGLGLAISQELMDAMSGRLWADFDPRGWLRLRLRLPAGSPSPAGRGWTPQAQVGIRKPALPPAQS